MILGLDFDGTCVTHEFPEIGADVGAVPWLTEWVARGNQIILWTIRSDHGTNTYLRDAVDWFRHNDIKLYGVNNNPTQHTWSKSPKAYCHVYIDDAALGTPLIMQGYGERGFVDWKTIGPMLLRLSDGK